MRWEKQDFIFMPDGEVPWMQSHAQTPTVYVMSDRLRVYFSTRNAAGKSQIACVDLDKKNPSKIIHLYDEPVLSFGKPGTFDDDGVMPSYVLEYENQVWMYYSGWNQRVTVPYHNAMGLAISHDQGLTFERIADGPIMDRTLHEPYIAVTPSILREKHIWKMWYISGIRWELIHSQYEPIYVIKYAESHDGITWQRYPEVVIEQAHSHEAFSRPYAVKIDGVYNLWYCYRGSFDFRDGTQAYRIGHAYSKDGVHWIRNDANVGITVSPNSFDSMMLCYPCIVQVEEKYYMFFNGNGFGKSGMGYATLQVPKI
jgi:sucrose-6-phosphate hydrolase SacC (GH32 family)